MISRLKLYSWPWFLPIFQGNLLWLRDSFVLEDPISRTMCSAFPNMRALCQLTLLTFFSFLPTAFLAIILSPIFLKSCSRYQTCIGHCRFRGCLMESWLRGCALIWHDLMFPVRASAQPVAFWAPQATFFSRQSLPQIPSSYWVPQPA